LKNTISIGITVGITICLNLKY